MRIQRFRERIEALRREEPVKSDCRSRAISEMLDQLADVAEEMNRELEAAFKIVDKRIDRLKNPQRGELSRLA